MKNKTEQVNLPLTFRNELSILLGENYKITRNRIDILLAVEKTGSISKAAKKVNMSYKGVWDAIYQIQNLSGLELVSSKTGGKGGGGAKLTEAAKKMVASFLESEKKLNRFLTSLEDKITDNLEFFSFIKRISVKTSARNQFNGIVENLETKKIRSLLKVRLTENLFIQASITNESIYDLGLEENKEVIILIKAPHVKTSLRKPETDMQNIFSGTVNSILTGDGYAEISIKVDNDIMLTSTMSEKDLIDAKIKEGLQVYCFVHSSDIVIGIS